LKEFWIAVLADIHYGRERLIINPWDVILRLFWEVKKVALMEKMEKRLRKLIELVNNYSRMIKFVAILGDLTESALECQFEKIREILDLLKRTPCVILPGCHDRSPYQREGRKLIWKSKKIISFSEFKRSVT
jgi:3',5'-cyclic AMP phosphodiesterase CpdA